MKLSYESDRNDYAPSSYYLATEFESEVARLRLEGSYLVDHKWIRSQYSKKPDSCSKLYVTKSLIIQSNQLYLITIAIRIVRESLQLVEIKKYGTKRTAQIRDQFFTLTRDLF
jgi:hypothetical protein